MKVETIILNKERNVTLTAYIQDVGGEYRTITSRPGIIVLPGGGYEFCSDREADPVAMPYLKAGFQVFILRYSTGEFRQWPQPINDYDEAYEYIASRAEEWHLRMDKIATIGFSAGGHMAGATATVAKHRPQATILGYAVLNETIDEINQGAPVIRDCVDANTSPCFLFATRTDSVVPIRNTVEMVEALTKYDIAYECHIYSYGPHGFSTADHAIQDKSTSLTERAGDWVEDSIGWLREMLGEFDKDCEQGMSKPVCRPHVSADADQWLSIDCSIGRLFGNPAAMEVLKPVVDEMREKIPPFSPELTFDDMMNLLAKMHLRDLLLERGIMVDELDAYDERLAKLPNI